MTQSESADPEIESLVQRLRDLYNQVGEEQERQDAAIEGILQGGPGVADRLRVTADAVAALWNIDESQTGEQQ